jgi:hypothetical protein
MNKLALASIAVASTANATLSTLNWTVDNPNGFSVDLTGIGVPSSTPSRSFEVISPSGLWDLFVGEISVYEPDVRFVFFPFREEAPIGAIGMSAGFDFAHSQGVDYRTSPYSDEFRADRLPIVEYSMWNGYGNELLGLNKFTITSILDLLNPATWGWEANYQGHKKIVSVPDTGSTVAMLSIALLCIAFIFQRTKQSNVTE